MTGEAAGPVPAAAGDGSGAVLTPAVSPAEPPSPAPRAQPGKLPAPGAFPWKGIRGKRVAAEQRGLWQLWKRTGTGRALQVEAAAFTGSRSGLGWKGP